MPSKKKSTKETEPSLYELGTKLFDLFFQTQDECYRCGRKAWEAPVLCLWCWGFYCLECLEHHECEEDLHYESD